MRVLSIWVEKGDRLRFEDWNIFETIRMYSVFEDTFCEHTLAVI